MRNFLTLYKRELKTLFLTPVGYIVMTAFLFVLGWVFWLLVGMLAMPDATRDQDNVFAVLFGNTFFYWIMLAAVSAALTMRLFAEERRSGTIEVLMTAPVTDVQVVMSKYGAALSFLLLLWVPTLCYVLVLSRYATIDLGILCASYLGTILLSALLTAIGLLISSLTRSQIVAFFVAFVVIMMLFSLDFMQTMVSPQWRAIYAYTSILEQFSSFPRGIIASRPIVYFLSATLVLLFCTVKSVESHKWR